MCEVHFLFYFLESFCQGHQSSVQERYASIAMDEEEEIEKWTEKTELWIQWGPWIIIRIRNPDPDPGGQK